MNFLIDQKYMKLSKTQQEILSRLETADDCGIKRVPIDGHRMCMAALKLDQMGLGIFTNETYWDRKGNKSIPSLISCGHFYLM